jgi:C4-dicarboxylate transporter DctM subunit
MGLTAVTISTLPWIITTLVFLGLITYVPQITLWLPHMLGMK